MVEDRLVLCVIKLDGLLPKLEKRENVGKRGRDTHFYDRIMNLSEHLPEIL